MTQALLELHATRVPDAWLDYNGHMNDGAYAIAFSHATDRLMEHIGVDGDYRAQTGLTIYTLENHIRYLREAGGGDAVNITTQLLEHDAKRLRVHHVLWREGESEPLATSEQMLLHVDGNVPAAAPFPQQVADRIEALARQQAGLPRPEGAGAGIRSLER